MPAIQKYDPEVTRLYQKLVQAFSLGLFLTGAERCFFLGVVITYALLSCCVFVWLIPFADKFFLTPR